jgi:hypothetical protein
VPHSESPSRGTSVSGNEAAPTSGPQKSRENTTEPTVRHIPIMVEGREEPLNIGAATARSENAKKPSDFYPPNVNKMPPTSLKVNNLKNVQNQEPTSPLSPIPSDQPIPMGYHLESVDNNVAPVSVSGASKIQRGEVENQNQDLNDIEDLIENNKIAIKDAERFIKKYEEQQMNVRNNREYDAITKEMELQHLEIQILEKKIKEAYGKIELKNSEIDETKHRLEEREKDLIAKKNELSIISTESEEDEKKYLKSRESLAKKVDPRLLVSYDRTRKNMRNGLAVVPVHRDACGGCFNIVPAQKQAEVREKKKIIICEHCGRILADVIEVIEPEVVIKRRTKRATTKKKIIKK